MQTTSVNKKTSDSFFESSNSEQQASREAGGYVSQLYDALAMCYEHLHDNKEEQRSLNILITRLVFLLFLQDAGLLQTPQAFTDWCHGDPSGLGIKLEKLFVVVDTPLSERASVLADCPHALEAKALAAFPYINGGLFSDKSIVVPPMSAEVLFVLTEASRHFNWLNISGVIFGSMFEGTLNPETRRKGGIHYTSRENIGRCLGPLFLDDLWKELRNAEGERSRVKRRARLEALHDRIAHITVGDPAAGSGNFLAEAYRQLRTIENRIIESEITDNQSTGQLASSIALGNPVRVSPAQFYGIELNDFAVAVTKTALWITELQMMLETKKLLPDHGTGIEVLPLTKLPTIIEGNALVLEWSTVFPDNLDYLVGNPPLVGYSLLSEKQQSERARIFGSKGGTLDYACCWFKLASAFIQDKRTCCAFVSASSLCQGQQVEPLWKPLFDEGIHIDFAHTTFRWDNEATSMSHVHAIIIGFSGDKSLRAKKPRLLLTNGIPTREVPNINGYLKAAPNVFVGRRAKPLCGGLEMTSGGKISDGGHLVLTRQERDLLLRDEPEAKAWIRPFASGKDFINGTPRYCLWLVGITQEELALLPLVQQRVEAVRAFRLSSKKAATRAKATTPWLFDELRTPQETHYIAMPKVSSPQLKFLPLAFVEKGNASPISDGIAPGGFAPDDRIPCNCSEVLGGSQGDTNDLVPCDCMPGDCIPGDKLFFVDGGGLFEFGVLSSTFHAAWMHAVSARPHNSYSYSNTLVYNNFVWPDCGISSCDGSADNASASHASHRAAIEACARGVLEARTMYEGVSLGGLYDPASAWLFPDLMRAHEALDAAVEAAYGVNFNGNEEHIAAYLFDRFAQVGRRGISRVFTAPRVRHKK